MPGQVDAMKAAPPRRRWLKGCAWGCGGTVVLFPLLVVLLALLLSKVPTSYPPMVRPIEPPSPADYAAARLEGFDSPYLGHTGSWDGKGGAMWGGSKAPDLDLEVGMGLRWTFMPVYWRVMEPDGPVDLSQGVPDAWRALDAFVIEAEKRRLNILMQAPVVGGNAGGPPDWAGRREPDKSAPADMAAAAALAGKLAARYAPGGTLAVRQGWGERYGVRAWELDNEPELYRTCWSGQAGDYAEFAAKCAALIKQADPRAVIVLPGCAGGGHAGPWLEAALDAHRLGGSPEYRLRGVPHSIGPVADVISFHIYEGLDSVFTDRTVERVFGEVRDVFEKWETSAAGFDYPRKCEYWHTEGNFDFLGLLSGERRAAWRMQFFTRAFAAGLRKVCVMDASAPEQAAVRAYVQALPWPFPMRPADAEVKVLRGSATAFRHPDGDAPGAGQVWVLWAVADTGDAEVEVPVVREQVTRVHVDGTRTVCHTRGGRLTVDLKGDRKMAPPILLVDRPTAGDG
jgi:hypothetical protein